MIEFLLLKWIHIISSVVLVGVGFGSAFYLYFINRSGNTAAIAEVTRLVVRADFWFTTPAIIIQPISGIWLASLGGYELSESWLVITYTLYILAGICWLPVVWLQLRMAEMSHCSVARKVDLPEKYHCYHRYWTLLGMIAFPAMLGVFALMVFRPSQLF